MERPIKIFWGKFKLVSCSVTNWRSTVRFRASAGKSIDHNYKSITHFFTASKHFLWTQNIVSFLVTHHDHFTFDRVDWTDSPEISVNNWVRLRFVWVMVSLFSIGGIISSQECDVGLLDWHRAYGDLFSSRKLNELEVRQSTIKHIVIYDASQYETFHRAIDRMPSLRPHSTQAFFCATTYTIMPNTPNAVSHIFIQRDGHIFTGLLIGSIAYSFLQLFTVFLLVIRFMADSRRYRWIWKTITLQCNDGSCRMVSVKCEWFMRRSCQASCRYIECLSHFVYSRTRFSLVENLFHSIRIGDLSVFHEIWFAGSKVRMKTSEHCVKDVCREI